MKKNTLWGLACTLILGLVTFSACSSDDDNNTPVTEPVLLSKIDMVTVMHATGDTVSNSTHTNIWEGGLLKKMHAVGIIKADGEKIPIELGYVFTYSGKNCTEIKTLDGMTVNSYTYDAKGRMTSATSKTSASDHTIGNIRDIQIKAYTKDGHIQQMEETLTYSWGETRKTSYDLTWKNGDLVKWTTHYLEPIGEDMTYEMEYDTYPSIYTGYPLARYIIEGPTGICYRGSMHNPISGGDIYKYKNGRVVSSVSGNNTSHYTYTDGTSE